MKAIRILLADDHRDFRKVVSDYLNRLPNVVVVGEACDGVDVIDKMEQLNADIVLMNIMMPLRNGLEATRIIKNRWPSKKVVLVTMHDHPIYRSQAEQAKADGFINKSSLKAGLTAVFGGGSFAPGSAPA